MHRITAGANSSGAGSIDGVCWQESQEAENEFTSELNPGSLISVVVSDFHGAPTVSHNKNLRRRKIIRQNPTLIHNQKQSIQENKGNFST